MTGLQTTFSSQRSSSMQRQQELPSAVYIVQLLSYKFSVRGAASLSDVGELWLNT